jgi:hypothetical protein
MSPSSRRIFRLSVSEPRSTHCRRIGRVTNLFRRDNVCSALVAYLLYTPPPKGSCNSIMKLDSALVCLGYINLSKGFHPQAHASRPGAPVLWAERPRRPRRQRAVARLSRANPNEARQAKTLTADEAGRIAVNIARLSELLGKAD